VTASWTHIGYAQQLVLGAGSVRRLPELLRAVGARRVLLVTSAGRLASDDGQRVVRALGPLLSSTFAEVASHVPTPTVQAAHRQARTDGVDAVVSFGGGSAADLAKAVAFFTEQEQGIPSTSWADRPAVPHVSVPTTYSGAELTPFFGMTDPSSRSKSGAGSPTCAPIAAVYDPELTLSTPVDVSAQTGMNALAHCVEAAWSPRRTPEAEALALAGARRLVQTLPLVVDDPGDLAVRTAVLEGAVLAARSLQNASMGVHHGLSQLLGGRTGIPHGLANAVLLAHSIRFNADAVGDVLPRLGEALGDTADPAGAVARLAARLGLPAQLGDCGVSFEDVEAVARASLQNPNVQANPKPVTEDDAHRLLLDAY
jgi:maleylacetate reductase